MANLEASKNTSRFVRPGGTGENSPALQCLGERAPDPSVPEGRLSASPCAAAQPSLRDSRRRLAAKSQR